MEIVACVCWWDTIACLLDAVTGCFLVRFGAMSRLPCGKAELNMWLILLLSDRIDLNVQKYLRTVKVPHAWKRIVMSLGIVYSSLLFSSPSSHSDPLKASRAEVYRNSSS